MLENHLDWTGGTPSVLNLPHPAILDNGECSFGNLAVGMFLIFQAEMGEPTVLIMHWQNYKKKKKRMSANKIIIFVFINFMDRT